MKFDLSYYPKRAFTPNEHVYRIDDLPRDVSACVLPDLRRLIAWDPGFDHASASCLDPENARIRKDLATADVDHVACR